MIGEMRSLVEDSLTETILIHKNMKSMKDDIVELSMRVVTTLNNHGTLFIMGNGGSAADAQHMAGEIVGRFQTERRGLPAVALSTDTSIMTAIANDFGYNEVFRRQIEASIHPGDAVLGISTSGSSGNILAGLEEARKWGATTLGLAGAPNSKMRHYCDSIVEVPTTNTPRIQEIHGFIIHTICSNIDAFCH